MARGGFRSGSGRKKGSKNRKAPEKPARFASFPDSFQWSGKWTDIYNRQGNSVPPNLMKAIAEHININILQRMTDAFPDLEIRRVE